MDARILTLDTLSGGHSGRMGWPAVNLLPRARSRVSPLLLERQPRARSPVAASAICRWALRATDDAAAILERAFAGPGDGAAFEVVALIEKSPERIQFS